VHIFTAEKHINYAWKVGFVWGLIVFMFALSSEFNDDIRQRFGYDLWNLFDVLVIFAFTYGIYKKSRIFSILLLAYFIISQITIISTTERYQGGLLALVFFYFYIQGIRGTFAYHQIKKNDEDYKVYNEPKKLKIIVGSILGIILLIIIVFFWIFAVYSPDTKIVPGAQLKNSYLSVIRDLKLLDPDEKIQFFYSDGLFDIKEGFYFFSDKKVVIYNETLEKPTIVIGFSEIEDIELDRSESSWDDSQITVYLFDETTVWFPVSNENDGDKKYYDSLVKIWHKNTQQNSD
jgi:hypothetical protein